jgi:hypothetical protein
LQGEEGTIQFQFSDGNAGRLLKHIRELDSGMNRTGGFKEGLEAHDLFGERKAALIEGIGLLYRRHELE